MLSEREIISPVLFWSNGAKIRFLNMIDRESWSGTAAVVLGSGGEASGFRPSRRSLDMEALRLKGILKLKGIEIREIL